MKNLACYVLLLFATQTDNIAGVLRGLRDINTIYYVEERDYDRKIA